MKKIIEKAENFIENVDDKKMSQSLSDIGIGLLAYYVITSMMFGWKRVYKEAYKPKNILIGLLVGTFLSIYAVISSYNFDKKVGKKCPANMSEEELAAVQKDLDEDSKAYDDFMNEYSDYINDDEDLKDFMKEMGESM